MINVGIAKNKIEINKIKVEILKKKNKNEKWPQYASVGFNFISRFCDDVSIQTRVDYVVKRLLMYKISSFVYDF